MRDDWTDCALGAAPVAPRPVVRGRAAFAVAVVGAAAVHAAALFAAVALEPRTLGAAGARVDGIEVTLVQGAAQESLATPVSQPASAHAVALAANEGDAPASAVAAVAAPVVPPAAEPPLAEKSPGDIITATLPPPKLPTEPPVIDAPLRAPADMTGATEGGVVARADALAPTVETAAGAPPGVVDAFKLAVQQALRKSRPPLSRGKAGAASIVFTIGPLGAVETAYVRASSGDPAQDQMAIAAVRATRFPKPDPRLTLAQRTWPISYQFAGSR